MGKARFTRFTHVIVAGIGCGRRPCVQRYLQGFDGALREGGACESMDGVARSRCQIRVLGQSVGGSAEPVGCGVIVGPTLAITCTHVVIAALGLEKVADPVLERREVRVRIPDDEPTDVRMRVLRAWPVDPQHPDLDGIERFHDICLLELYDNDFPASDGSRVATLCTQLPENGKVLVGSGTSGKRDVTLSCELGEPSGTRSMLTSTQSDKAIRPGCSGAGLFWPGEGMVGMISDGQGRMAGFMIQARVLAEALGRAATVSAPAAAKRADVHSALFRKLDTLDRQPQELDFDDYLQISQQRRSGLVCTLGGFDTDQPYLCRDRLARDAFKLAGCAPEIGDRALPVELPVPSLSEMSAEDALRRLKNGLKRELGAASIDAADLVAKLEERAVPLIAYSRVDEDALKSRNYRDLIRRWAEFVDGATRGKVALKLVHFLVIHLRGASDATDEEALAKRYRAAVKALNGDLAETDDAPILRIQLLKRVASNDVQDWVREAGVALTLDRDLVTSIQIRAAAQFPDESRPRFAEVAAWIRQLNLQAEQQA